ncbi:MAG TPA: hypothetical protein VHL34_25075 [Rhizomicrobium sp.]|nr:hypothetical protein [Rhizomicrobium sp.]
MAETKNTATANEAAAAANVAPASTFSPSGAPHQTTEFDPGHPAVDNDPRAGTTAEQNRIDFNDPRSAAEIAAEQLEAQAKKA